MDHEQARAQMIEASNTQSDSARSRWPRINSYALAGGSRIGVQIVGLLTMMAAVARLDPNTFGAFSLGWLVTVIGNTILYAGLYQYLLRSRDVEADKHSVFGILLLEGVACSLCMAIAGGAAYAAGSHAVATSLIALAPLTLLSAGSAWCDAMLTRRRRTGTVALIYLMAEVLGSVVLLAALVSGLSLWALLSWRVASTTAALIGLAWATDGLPSLRWSAPAARAALDEGLPLQGGTLLRTLAIYAADYLLAFFLNPAAAGAYRAASRVSVAGLDVFLQPLRPTTWETMARHEREENLASMASSYLEQLRFVTFFAVPVLACTALFSGRLFSTFAAAGWASAAPVLTLLALARVLSIFDFFLDPVLVCTGRSRLQFRLRTLQTCLVLLGVALTARYGPIAVAGWQLLASASIATVATLWIARILPLRPSQVLSAVVPALGVTVLCCTSGETAFRALPLAEPLRLIVSIAAMAGGLLAFSLVMVQRRVLRLPAH
jgi:O-antigen/teichoic acid export membrane protein